MRRSTAIGLLALTMTVLSARPASAQYGWFKWIQELSGPGPFKVAGATVTVWCDGDDAFTQGVAKENVVYRKLGCDRVPFLWPTAKFFVTASAGWGKGENNLEYPEKESNLSAVVLQVGGAFRPAKWFDVGAGVGLLRLSGAPETVSKAFVEPFVSIRPLAGLGGPGRSVAADSWARAVDLTLALTIFPQGFRLDDFGAVGGPNLTGSAEFLKGFVIKIGLFY